MEQLDFKRQNTLEFHNPDTTWSIWGISDYNTYLNKYLIRGKFHKYVPQEIKDAYRTVEYLIAHAYYFYPMYDEALSKVLRTIEMAVKLRCSQIGIEIERPRRQGSRSMVKRILADLIHDVVSAETEKELDYYLESARNLRNYSMHPDSNSYMGGISLPRIIISVNTFNILFAPTAFFRTSNTRKTYLQEQVSGFTSQELVLTRNDKRYLILSFEITDVFVNDEKELICLYIIPVLNIPDNPTKDDRYAEGFSITCEKFALEDGEITAIETNNQTLLRISISIHPQNTRILQQYRDYLSQFHMEPFNSIDNLFAHNKYKGVAEFRYSNYHLIE